MSKCKEYISTFLLPALLVAVVLLSGCGADSGGEGAGGYKQISQEEAAEMMTQDDGHVIVDVRRPDEYDEGHIPGAILIPNESIGEEMPEQLPDKDQIILIYCRSGNRSKEASQKLTDMGYTNIYEFGGISTWPGETVKNEGEMEHAVMISIESNPTTGFSWEAEQDNELFKIQDEYTADPQDEPVSGSGGVQVFIMTPAKAGTVRVTFNYTRPWEPSDADPQFTCTFEIDEDMKITVIDDGKDQAEENGYVTEMEIN